MTLPRTVQGLGGPATVRIVPDLSDQATDNPFGRTRFGARLIEIAGGLEDATQISTFYHELFHLALWDSGQHHDFDERTTEKLCDLVGSMMARLSTRP